MIQYLINTKERGYCVHYCILYCINLELNLHVITHLHNIIFIIRNRIRFSNQSVNGENANWFKAA